MLINLHVKNLAIIKEEEIEFGKGLNILSGETGAGKSIILGALGLTMGDKPIKGLVRDEEEEAFAEAIFSVNERQKARLLELGFETPEDEIILQRKITPQRAAAKINGESVPAGKLAQVAGLLIDIYGQHEQQTLLSPKNHIALLDEYAGSELSGLKSELSKEYDNYKALRKEFDEATLEDSQRAREIDLLTHEISEIESANLNPGEDLALKEEYMRLSKSEKILSAVSQARSAVGEDVTEGIGRAIRLLLSVEEYAPEIKDYIEALSDGENILREALSGLLSFEETLELNPQRINEVSQRIDLIDSLKRRFSKNGTIEEIFETLEINSEKLSKLENYEKYIEELKGKLGETKERLLSLCEKVSTIRKDKAKDLSQKVTEALFELNFTGANLNIRVEPLESPERSGMDKVLFYITTNPGEPERPLNDIASGGELSRIMLAIKTIFAGGGEIDTLVFDEIDSGVSGKTAAKVAERLRSLSGESQVICITHLPQIAAKATKHFLIEKNVRESTTVSSIRPLNSDEHLKEVARMLAGDSITEAALENARMLM